MIADVQIHALSTGTVQVKRCFLFPKPGLRRQLALFMPDEFSDPLPIHVWAIEHDGRLILVDTGETANVNNVPFARFGITPEQELPGAFAGAGLQLADVDTVVLTHMHGDHMDGAVHAPGSVLVHGEELDFQHSAGARFFQKVLRQPIPSGVDFQQLTLDDGPFGAFERSKRLTDDGRVVAVATPGHTPAHISVIAVDDDGTHLLFAGDATDTLEQLHARRADAIGPKPAVSVATLDRILAHGREHPTVYLPSHDLESAARLRDRVTL
jgi:glyoxylase-like metal-dependent hydrolase (beta-lactamase superfamily II)